MNDDDDDDDGDDDDDDDDDNDDDDDDNDDGDIFATLSVLICLNVFCSPPSFLLLIRASKLGRRQKSDLHILIRTFLAFLVFYL